MAVNRLLDYFEQEFPDRAAVARLVVIIVQEALGRRCALVAIQSDAQQAYADFLSGRSNVHREPLPLRVLDLLAEHLADLGSRPQLDRHPSHFTLPLPGESVGRDIAASFDGKRIIVRIGG